MYSGACGELLNVKRVLKSILGLTGIDLREARAGQIWSILLVPDATMLMLAFNISTLKFDT